MNFKTLAVFILQVSAVVWAQNNSATKWKEYVYSDNGFAMTLPSDPHPHKSSQMPNGTAYTVQLQAGVALSLHSMQAADCNYALDKQAELYAEHKNGAASAESNGFKVFSFRRVKGDGYNAVELVQQVPNGKMDYERWICSPVRLYIFTSEWNASEQQPPEIERIVTSFRLLTTK